MPFRRWEGGFRPSDFENMPETFCGDSLSEYVAKQVAKKVREAGFASAPFPYLLTPHYSGEEHEGF
jgi:hypothetical protein